MTLEEKLEKFKNGTAVLCAPTQGLWDNLMRELERRGCRWRSGTRPTDKAWDSYWSTIVLSDDIIGYWNYSASALKITNEDFAAPLETVESVMKSILLS